MAGLGHILIAAAVAVHLTVGCCWHHAHACDRTDAAPPVHGAPVPDGQCHEGVADHAHHGPNDCQGAKCSAVSLARTAGDPVVLPCRACFAALLDDLRWPVGVVAGQHFFPAGRLLLPVRLHLANQVLLI